MIAAKRQIFHSEIRSKQIREMMAKIRLKVSKENRTEILQSAIAATEKSINNQQLTILFKLGILGHENATIHLGNLFIDGIITAQMIENHIKQNPKERILGNNDYYMRLMHIIYEKSYFNEKYLLHLIDTIIQKVERARKSSNMECIKGNSILCEHGLGLLKQIISKHSSAVQLILSEQYREKYCALLRALLNICQSGLDRSVTTLSYSIINRFSAENSISLIKVLGNSNFTSLIQTGLLRVQSNIRCFTHQILANTILCVKEEAEPLFMKILCKIISVWPDEKIRVQVQISYMLLNCIKQFSLDSLIQMVMENDLLKQLKYFIESHNHEELMRNCCQIFKDIRSIREELWKFKFYDETLKCQILWERVTMALQSNS